MPSSRAPVITVAVEGVIDEAVVHRLMGHVGARLGPVFGKSGKSALYERMSGYVHAAEFSPWLIVVDLDHDFRCAADLRRGWVSSEPAQLCFRVAVREIEAWLMGDYELLARFMAIPKGRLPKEPDTEENPKRKLVDLAQHSRQSAIKADFVPRPGSGREVGPGYTARLMDFAQRHWRPGVADQRSTSLARAVRSLRRFIEGLM